MPGAEAQTLSLSDRTLSIADGNSVELPAEADGDVTNELQQLTLEGNVLSLSHDGGTVTLPAAGEQKLQDISLEGNRLSITDGSTVELPTAAAQTLTLSDRTLSIADGNSVELPTEQDGDATNEIQKFNFEGAVNPRVLLSHNNANFRLIGGRNLSITRPTLLGDIVFDVDLPEMEPTFQKFNFEGAVNPRVLLSGNDANFRLIGGRNTSITRPNGLGDITIDVDVPEQTDPDPANELQSLSLSGNTLSLSQGGGSIQLPATGGAVQSFKFEGSSNPRVLLSENNANFRLIGGRNTSISRVSGTGDITIDVAGEDATNELQTLSLSGNTLSLSRNGGSVTLPSGTGGTGTLQSFNFQGTSDPRILLSENDANFRLIGGRNATVSRTSGTGDITIDVAADGDGDSANELQTLSLSGNTLSLSRNGGSVTLPSGTGGTADADADPTNELQDFRFEGTFNPRILLTQNNANFRFVSGDNILVSRPSGKGEIRIDAIIPRDGDGDSRNEIQTITYDETNQRLVLSRDGGYVDLNPIIDKAEARLQSLIDSQEATNLALKQNVENLQMELTTLQEQLMSLRKIVEAYHPD